MANAPGQGRRAKPTALKLLDGNPGKQKLPENEPVYDVKLPICPAHLDADARKIWFREGRRMVSAGVLTIGDGITFAAWCAATARWQQLSEMLKRTGMVMRSADGGITMNPLLRAVRDAQADVLRLSTEFGLTPSSRSRIQAAKPIDEAEDDEAWWLPRSAGR